MAKKKKIPPIVSLLRNYSPEPINYAIDNGISYSQLSMYNKCPKQWKLQYRDKIKLYQPSMHAVFGTSIHETLQHYLTVMYDTSGANADREDLVGYFESKYRLHYKKEYIKNNNKHFTTPEQMLEFFEDGVNIINHFQKNKSKYFSIKGWNLAAIELPLILVPNKQFPNVKYVGYLDIVMYHEETNTFHIIDLKTSTSGWKKSDKENEEKQFQLILYKQFFSTLFNIDKSKINVEFIILRRKVYTEGDFPQKPIQIFVPPTGPSKINKALTSLNTCIESCFGNDIVDFTPNPSKWNCVFCPFLNTEHCKNGIS